MNPLEVIGFVFGVAGIWLTIKENIWCFPVGLVNVIVSFFLFYEEQLYSDTLQQAVYVVLLSYGWYAWVFKKGDKKKLPITGLSLNYWLLLIVVMIVVAFGMGTLFAKNTDADIPYLDAGATAICFVAQFLIARKKIENWYLWLIANAMYIGIFIYKDLYLYSTLHTAYFILAIIGLNTWSKQRKIQNA
ncbi:MAG: nicotinamide mononucleotide transporter [Bacteroidia bacterium]|nr:nicotinamide mononucleotide transporter [Bacteroidia bacterium]